MNGTPFVYYGDKILICDHRNVVVGEAQFFDQSAMPHQTSVKALSRRFRPKYEHNIVQTSKTPTTGL